MTSFPWKRKAVDKKIKQKSNLFDLEEEDEEKSAANEIKRRKIEYSDPIAFAERLKQEGIFYAENNRFCEAIDKLQRAVQLNPNDATLFEMISQIQQQNGDFYEAVTSAEKSVKLDPLWSIAFQTLGRAQLNMGEVNLALFNFSRAVHLNPSAEDVRNEDIPWALSLKRQLLVTTNVTSVERTNNFEALKAFVRRRDY